jgi:hypothetical protein
MNILHNIGALGVACLISLNLSAESSHHEHHHEHSHDREVAQQTKQQAHLHGYAELTLALEGSALEISFESPAANIVGFEHKPTSNEQLQVIDSAQQILSTPAELFSLSAGNCSLTEMNTDFPAILNDQAFASGNSESAHNESAHKAEQESHSEITASYKFHCPQGEKLNTIGVNLINRFPRIEKIKAMWLTATKQAAVELTAKSNLIQIK